MPVVFLFYLSQLSFLMPEVSTEWCSVSLADIHAKIILQIFYVSLRQWMNSMNRLIIFIRCLFKAGCSFSYYTVYWISFFVVDQWSGLFLLISKNKIQQWALRIPKADWIQSEFSTNAMSTFISFRISEPFTIYCHIKLFVLSLAHLCQQP